MPCHTGSPVSRLDRNIAAGPAKPYEGDRTVAERDFGCGCRETLWCGCRERFDTLRLNDDQLWLVRRMDASSSPCFTSVSWKLYYCGDVHHTNGSMQVLLLVAACQCFCQCTGSAGELDIVHHSTTTSAPSPPSCGAQGGEHAKGTRASECT